MTKQAKTETATALVRQHKLKYTVSHTFDKFRNVGTKHCAVTSTDDTQAPEYVQCGLEQATITHFLKHISLLL